MEERKSVNSTNVKSVGYDAEERVLEVEFRSGGIYQYAGVQPEMYADLLKAESVGRFVSKVVRAGRRGLKVEERGEDDGPCIAVRDFSKAGASPDDD